MRFSSRFFPALAALTLLPTLAAQTPPPPSLTATLKASRWQQRLLLIGAPTAAQADFQQQKKLLTADATGLATRDLKIIELPYDHLTPADQQCWTQQLGQPLQGFRVVLIGKDGGVKRVETAPLALGALFGTIDKMPMRREEMRGGK